MAVDPNGAYFDWSSIEIDVGGVKYDQEFEEISYGEKGSFKVLNGRGMRPKGRTRGKLEYEGKLKMSREAWADLLRQLQSVAATGDFRDAQIDITVNYGNAANAQSDKLKRVKLHSPNNSHSNSEDALMVELEMSIMDILWDGETEDNR